jgi:hypothetical protein
MDIGDVAEDERLELIVALAKRCWYTQREHDAAAELRHSLARQVTDLTQQLTILEDENALLRNIGLSAANVGLSAAALHEPDHADLTSIREHVLQDKDEAIFVLTQHARALEEVRPSAPEALSY